MDKKCIIVVNNLSGGYKAVHEDDLLAVFGNGFQTEIFHIQKNNPFVYAEAQRVVVCGGDGTLNWIINLYRGKDTEIVYCPFGTLNETSKRDIIGDGDFVVSDGGEADGKYFSYVLATGTFTPLGYDVDMKIKQQIKSFAYIINVLKQLKVWRVNAELTTGGKTEKGQYSLIMALHSPQCFGLHFNKMFALNDGKIYMLTVRSPRFNGFFGLAELFFPFFRAFFIGFKKPYKSKKMEFKEISELSVTTDKPCDFCVDGERWNMPVNFSVKPVALIPAIRVVTPKTVRRKAQSIKDKAGK